MRGKTFHNHITQELMMAFTRLNWHVHKEFCVRRNGVIIYFDLLALMGNLLLGCQVETSVRHIIENAQKACAVDIPTWFIVPTRKIRNLAAAKLQPLNITPGSEPIQLLLPGQLEKELVKYLPLTIAANSYKDR